MAYFVTVADIRIIEDVTRQAAHKTLRNIKIMMEKPLYSKISWKEYARYRGTNEEELREFVKNYYKGKSQ